MTIQSAPVHRKTLARSDLRRLNRSLILRHIILEGPLSRSQLRNFTGLTSGAVSRITNEMIAAGLLAEGEAHAPKGKPGPRFVALDVVSEGGYVIGLGLEASTQQVGLLNLRGSLVARRSLRLRRLADPGAVAEAVANAVRQLIVDHNVPSERVFGIGAAVIGIVDPFRGLVLESPYLKWRNTPFAAHLNRATGLPIVIEGLLHALNLAEANHGPHKGPTNVIYVHTTLGLGASILAGGALLRGGACAAGQIGHVRVSALADHDVQPTPLAALSSGRAILRSLGLLASEGSAREDFADALRILQNVLRDADDADTPEARAVDAAGERLGEYLGGLCGVLNPEQITLGGVLGRHPEYIRGVTEGMTRQPLVPEDYRPELTVSEMDSTRAGALLALNHFVLTRGLDLPVT